MFLSPAGTLDEGLSMLINRLIARSLPVAAILIAATGASAATVSSTVNISVAAPSSYSTSNPFSVNLPQFNPALGTLVGATISTTLSSVQEYVVVKDGQTGSAFFPPFTVTYDPNTPYSFSTKTGFTLVLQAPSDSTFPNAYAGYPYTLTVPTNYTPNTTYTGITPSTPGVYALVDTYTTAFPEYDYSVQSANLASLTGTGTLPVAYSVQTGLSSFNYDSAVVNPSVQIGSAVGTEKITYTYELNGDANLDDKVDLTDLNIVLNHLGTTDSLRADGNFDGAATIDLTDLNEVLNNLGTSATSSNIGSSSIVAAPEPASLSLLAVGSLFMIRRSRRKA
jgi:hypothetical protein